MKRATRTRELELLVEDSGRTWAVMYDEINRIRPSAVERGDVFIVHHRTEPGVMIMQALRSKPNGWVLEEVQFAPKAGKAS